MSFEDYFSVENIFKCLAKIKANAVVSNSNARMYNAIHELKKNSKNKELSKYFPPRSKWVRIGKRTGNPIKDHSKSLYLTFLKYQDQQDLNWIKNIRLLHQEILVLVKQEIPKQDFVFSYTIIPFLKEKPPKKNSPKLTHFEENIKYFRPVCNFSLKHKIVVNIASKYYTDFFDHIFEPCSCAFRANKSKSNREFAIKKILQFRAENKDIKLYASECDIKSFYDTINHNVIINSLGELVNLSGKALDPNFENIFLKYLASYSFQNVIEKEIEIFKRFKIKKGLFKYPKSELKELYENNQEKFGIPQGGAISCFISNLVLHFIDFEIVSFPKYRPVEIRVNHVIDY